MTYPVVIVSVLVVDGVRIRVRVAVIADVILDDVLGGVLGCGGTPGRAQHQVVVRQPYPAVVATLAIGTPIPTLSPAAAGAPPLPAALLLVRLLRRRVLLLLLLLALFILALILLTLGC